MLAPLLLAAQSTVIPLSLPHEADLAFRAAFLPDASGVIVTHGSTPNATLLPLTMPFPSETAEVGRFGVPAVAPDGSTAVIAGLGAGNAGVLSILDLPSLQVRASLAAPFSLNGEVVIDSTSRWAAVLPRATNSSGIQITIVDLTTDAIAATIPIGGGTSPRLGVLAGAGTTLIAAGVSGQDYALFSIDLTSGTVVNQVVVDSFIKGLAASSDGQRIAALLGGTDPSIRESEVLILDANSLTVAAEWDLPLPWDQLMCQIEFADDDRSLYVAGDRRPGGDALRLELASGSVQPLGLGATSGLSLSADDERLFFLSPADNAPLFFEVSDGTVRVVEASSGLELNGLNSSEFTSMLVPAPIGNTLIRVLADSTDRIQVLTINGQFNPTVVDRPSSNQPQSDGPYHLEVLPDGSALIAGSQSNNLRIIDTTNGLESSNQNLSGSPVEVLVRGNNAVVAMQGNASLWILARPSLSVVQTVQLPSPPCEMQSAAAETQVWVRTSGSMASLALVETSPATASVMTLVPLAGECNAFLNWERLSSRSSDGQSFAVDSQGSRAFAVSETQSGTLLEVLDLELDQVVGTTVIPVQVEGRPDVRVSPDATRLYVSTSAAEIFAFDVSTNQPALEWTTSCTPDSWLAPIQLGHIELSPSGDQLLATLGPWSHPTAGCPQTVALDAATGDILQILDLPVDTLNLQRVDDAILRVSRTRAEIIREQGTGFLVTKSLSIPAAEGEISLDRQRGKLLVPNGLDQLYVFDLIEDQVTSECSPAEANATGQPAALSIEGSALAGEPLTLRASGLRPDAMPGYLAIGSQTVAPISIEDSPSPLCIGGAIGRLFRQVQPADSSGVQTFKVDTERLPVSGVPTSVQPGQTWTFQSWYRDYDVTGAPRSNFSDALAVTFL